MGMKYYLHTFSVREQIPREVTGITGIKIVS